jgi:RNA polymerase sigma factor (sigma-70 family)
MLSPRLQPYSHEDIFLERYQWLRGWSLQLTQHSQEQAEDLLHDVFIQFTIVRPDLSAIHNIDGYLYTMLRNLQLSNLRRAARAPTRPLSILDFDSAEIGLRMVGPRERIQVREQLWMICQYACVRKETSKAGSILILRFFHGYYPSEIAQILRGPRRAVDDWLSIARREARSFLENPTRPIAWKNRPWDSTSVSIVADTPDFLEGPRRAIFRSRKGSCLTDKELRQFYIDTDEGPVDCAFLSHLASCPSCLDTINDILGLPPLNDRHPTDMLGPDTSGSNGRRPGRTSAKLQNHFAAAYNRRSRDVFDHRPTELSLAVNGFVLSSQTLGYELTRQTLTVNTPEKIGFVEAFSEQGIRLLYLHVDQPPDGPVEQSAEVEFGGGRTLSLSIGFSGAWPMVSAVYRDPEFKPADLSERSTLDERPAAAELRPEMPLRRAEIFDLRSTAVSWLVAFRRWVRPSTITAALAVLLIITALIVPMRGPSVSAAELLTRASAAEESAQRTPGALIHRVLEFEKHAAKDGAPVTRHRIEIWLDPSKGIQARRVYDERNRIVAAEWTNYDGLRWVYQPEAMLRFEQQPQRNAKAILEAGDLWQMNLSAQDFSAVLGRIGMAAVERQAGTYIISYRNASSAASNVLQEARITLTGSDLHAVEQSLVVRRGGEAIEYKFVESTLDRVTPQRAGPSIFQIDPDLMTGAPDSGDVNRPLSTPDESSNPEPAGNPALRGLTTQALTNLALDALYQLHRMGACTEEQATLSRTAGGGLRIQAVVASEKRKRDMLHALTSLINNPALNVEIDTEAEAAKRHMNVGRSPLAARDFQVTLDRMPAYDELRRYYENAAQKNGGPSAAARIDEDTRRFAAEAINRSRRGLTDAWALRRHFEEIPSSELSLLDPERRATFRSMIAEHAAAFRLEMRRLHAELQPVFMPAGLARETAGPLDSSDSRRDVERIFELASSIDEEIRRAFSSSVGEPAVPQIKTERFWRSLELAERLAGRVKDR